MSNAPALKICLAASEFAPLAKTGGLADVCAALSAYLHQNGHDVRVLIPMHRVVRDSGLVFHPVEYLQDIHIRLGPHDAHYSIDTAQLPGTTQSIYFLRCPVLFDQPGIYSSDNEEHYRYILLSRAAIEMCQRMGFAPDIFHAHDWHTALIPLYLKTVYAWDQLFANTKSVLTIHNIGYQGVFNSDTLGDLGLGRHQHELHQADLAAGQINFLKTAVLHADVLTTVSPTYAREIQTDEFGMGLQDLLRARRTTLLGILNGVDYNEWNPEKDQFISHQYSWNDLAGKKENKKELIAKLGLRISENTPLIGMVTRLTSQKGLDLVQSVLPHVLQSREAGVAILGSGEPAYEEFFGWLQSRFPGRVCYYRGFNNSLAHWIEAGSDMFLMPSLFEPCGLNQMYSLRYGTVPIVRRTGGLADTVQLYEPETRKGNGIVFRDYNEIGLLWAINTALDLYSDQQTWTRIVRNGMLKDFSWNRQGAIYVELFRRILHLHDKGQL
ncbi:MAG: glycogen synthase GlgA [Gammaproteobacteria bacterium]|nr:glycogen synthase GlgA [Gammaproteobacteria bacterium]